MILGVHAHLGGILHEGGGSLIARTGVTKARAFDPVSISESTLRRGMNEDGIDFRAVMPIPSHEPAARLR
ncbi:MAG TPA: hypothetical protein VLM75_04955 [Spirochaetota bacterium]|nr:hypothetical protein [Spirochaetota bacterium]